MADTPQTHEKEPAPRTPRQPDPKLITYLERGRDHRDESDETEAEAKKS